MPVTIGRERVAGSPEGSSAGKTMCAVITASTPASTTARNGGSSSSSHRARVCRITGSPTWLSVSVSPCPGKCFAVAATPAPW